MDTLSSSSQQPFAFEQENHRIRESLIIALSGHKGEYKCRTQNTHFGGTLSRTHRTHTLMLSFQDIIDRAKVHSHSCRTYIVIPYPISLKRLGSERLFRSWLYAIL